VTSTSRQKERKLTGHLRGDFNISRWPVLVILRNGAYVHRVGGERRQFLNLVRANMLVHQNSYGFLILSYGDALGVNELLHRIEGYLET